MSGPFQIEKKDGVLFLMLNTLGASVNIFDLTAATQFELAIRSLSPINTRAVVIRSSKPRSFINGAGLLMSSSVIKSTRVAFRLSSIIYKAHQSLRNSRIPTIAAIEGNCYGGGLEFASNCNYRLATDTIDAQFSMPEIQDYLFIPGLGGTQNLPRLLGLQAALDLVLWGERWDAITAKRKGLIDRVFPQEEFEDRLKYFLRNVSRIKPSSAQNRWPRKGATKTSVRQVVNATRKRILTLPPKYQKLYFDCLHLMVNSLGQRELAESDYNKEYRRSIRSIMTPASKSAVSFFFTRRIAQVLCVPEEGLPQHLKIVFPFTRNDDSMFQFAKNKRTEFLLRMATATNLRQRIVYNPFFKTGSRFMEIALNRPADSGARLLFTQLSRIGFTPVFSRSCSFFATNELLVAYLAPQITFCLKGGAPASVLYTLRSFGFCTLSDKIIRNAGIKRLANLLEKSVQNLESREAIFDCLRKLSQATFIHGRREQSLLDAIDVSLYATVHRLLKEGIITHPAIADLIAREILDFPLEQQSLCAYLNKERIRVAMSRSSNLVSRELRQVCIDLLMNQQDFYLSRQNFSQKEIKCV